MSKLSERAVSIFKYLIAVYMILAGLLTTVATQEATNGQLGWLYSSRIALVIIGLLIFVSGATLLYGKIRRSRKWTGRGLFYVYLCFVFATILNTIAYGFVIEMAIGNLIGVVITGALWLRWKFKTEYVNPNHFRKEIDEMRRDLGH